MMIHELARAIAIFGTLSLFQLIASRNHKTPPVSPQLHCIHFNVRPTLKYTAK
ncbi:hypothetical protein [Alkalicoccobacillus plakortidis]|uniref:Uncharacterized protein n=1 Tax=Alkalicoccobacillus plakortidis TaxID=444060 RepID=A0ABT0XMX1_9BACI|nr:hypothetical protein [Alkalicoccobacillus plakortidis]MCM2676589.1 hypothetical protein [Alkalicoccobacillus plakortidis]